MPPDKYCGKCDNFVNTGGGGGASGFCNKISLGTGPGGVPQWKIVKYFENALKCPEYKELDMKDVITDVRQEAGRGKNIRSYKDFDLMERDVNIDQSKVSDPKNWG